MPVSSVFQRIRWAIAIPGLLLLLAATWLYPTASVDHWSDSQWKRSLAGSTWTFSRHDGSLISDQVRLSTVGKIRGYSHPNEHAWDVRDKRLELVDIGGKVTSTFTLGVGAPLAGLALVSDGGGGHELHMRTDRHILLRLIAAAGALLGLAMLAASLWMRPLIPSAYLARASARFSARFSFINGKYCALALLGGWFLLASVLASMPAYLPDEAWFLYEALRSAKAVQEHGDWVRELVFHRNSFGYGGLWWTIYTGVVLAWDGIVGMFAMPSAGAVLAADPGIGKVMLWEHISPALFAPLIMMRILALTSLAGFGLVLVRGARTGAGALLAILVLITMPVAWWGGKLASPELLGAALFAMAVWRWFGAGRALSALVLASISLGTKLTIAPIYAVFVCFVVWGMRRTPEFSWRRLATYGLICVMAVLVCNSWIFYEPKAGIDQLVFLSKSYAPNPDWTIQSNLVLSEQTENWEGGNYGSLMYWAGGASVLIAAFVTALVVNRRLAGFILIGAVAQYAFMMTQPPHGWYWFPVILSAVVPFGRLGPKGAGAMGLILLVLLYPFGYLQHELSYKSLHLRELEQVALQQQCVRDKLTAFQPDVVYDMAAIGTFIAGRGQHGWTALNFHESFIGLVMAPSKAPGAKQVLLLGERSEHNFGGLRALSETPGKLIGTCAGIKLVDVSK